MPEFCRTCKAPVFWALTPSGAKAPVDVEPVDHGNVLLLAPSGIGKLAVVLSGDLLTLARQAPHVHLRTNHWATCPDRQEWRERTDAKRAAEAAGWP